MSALDWLTAFVVNTRATHLRISPRLFTAIQYEILGQTLAPNTTTLYRFMDIPVEFKSGGMKGKC